MSFADTAPDLYEASRLRAEWANEWQAAIDAHNAAHPIAECRTDLAPGALCSVCWTDHKAAS